MRKPDYPSEDHAKWAAVDDYFSQLLLPTDRLAQAALVANSQARLPAHDVSALQGNMLALFIKMLNAARVLEIGTLGGYSTILMAQALGEEGKITTLEADAHHAQVASDNIRNAGLSGRVESICASVRRWMYCLTCRDPLISSLSTRIRKIIPLT